MMTRRIVPLLAAALLALAGGAAAARAAEDEISSPDVMRNDEPAPTEGRKYYSLGVRAGPWFGYMDAKIKYPLDNVNGKFTVDVHDDDTLPYGEIFLTTKYLSLYVDYWQGNFHEAAPIHGSLSILGLEFSGDVDASLDAKVITAGGRLQVNPIALDWLEVGLSLGGRYLRIDGKVSGEEPITNQHVSATRRVEAPLPQLGLSLTVFLGDRLDVYARARGMTLTYQDYHYDNVEGELGFAVNFFHGHLSVGAEYRLFYLNLDDRRDVTDGNPRMEVEATLHGPMVFLQARF